VLENIFRLRAERIAPVPLRVVVREQQVDELPEGKFLVNPRGGEASARAAEAGFVNVSPVEFARALGVGAKAAVIDSNGPPPVSSGIGRTCQSGVGRNLVHSVRNCILA